MFRKLFILSQNLENTINYVRLYHKTSNVLEARVGALSESLKKNINSSADMFGTLDKSNFDLLNMKDDPEDASKLYSGMKESIKKIEASILQDKFDDAIAVLQEIQKREKVPSKVYRLLISYKAKLGDIKGALHLYNDLKRRGNIPCKAMYTSLFKACAISSDTELALKVTNKLWNYTQEKGLKLNLVNFHAILRVYGKHGDFRSAIQVFDHLREKNYKINRDTYNFLLEACRHNRSFGLRFALLVWHDILHHGIKPSCYTLCKILECVTYCGMGEPELFPEFKALLQKITKGPGDKGINFKSLCKSTNAQNVKRIKHSTIEKILNLNVNGSEALTLNNPLVLNDVSNTSDTLQSVKVVQNTNDQELLINLRKETELHNNYLPNLLLREPVFGQVIEFKDLSTPQNRFLLLGGLKGFIETAKTYCKPITVHLITLLLNCIPPTQKSEHDLLEFARRENVKLDTAFFNELLLLRIKRGEKKTVKGCVHMFIENGVIPDAYTIGIISLSCNSRESIIECVNLARKHKIRLNGHVITNLMKRAGQMQDLESINQVLQFAKEDRVTLKPSFMIALDKFIKRQRNSLQKVHCITSDS